MRPVIMTRHDDDSVTYDRPLVTMMADKVIRQQGIDPAELGYRLVRREPSLRGGIYARPWINWAVRRFLHRVSDYWWGILSVAYHRGWLHMKYEYREFRWRDIRWGRDPNDRS